MIRFTPETGVHGVALLSQVGRLADIVWSSVAAVYLWTDSSPFFHWAGVVLFVFAFLNHANRWSGWKERDSYTRNNRK